MSNGMHSDDARRVRLTGNQLKAEFIKKYTHDGTLLRSIKLVQPFDATIKKSITIKTGRNWQFRLGNIPEIQNHVKAYHNNGRTIKFEENICFESTLLTVDFLTKYAFKSNFFVIRNNLKWQIFTSKDIISLILDNCTIRLLNSGRIKFDFHNKGKTTKGIMTIEYRPEEHKKSWVFGAHGGGSGEKLRKLFVEHLLFTELTM